MQKYLYRIQQFWKRKKYVDEKHMINWAHACE